MNGWRTLSLLWLFKLVPSLLFAAPPPPGGKSLSIADPNIPSYFNTRQFGSWTIEEVRVLSSVKDYSDPLSVQLGKWNGGLFALRTDAEILAAFSSPDRAIPARVRAAGSVCLPSSSGHLHPVGRAVSKDGSSAIALFWALAYRGDKAGFEHGVLVAFEASKAKGVLQYKLIPESGYSRGVLKELMVLSNDWKALLKDHYAIRIKHGANGPKNGGTTTWTNNPDDLDEGYSRIMSVGMRITVPRSEVPQNLLAALESGGKAAWLGVVDYWLSEKTAMIQEFVGKGNQVDADRVASTIVPLKFDRHLYSLGMRPPDEYCQGVIPWWWENCSNEQWEKGEQLDFLWQALGWQTYEPYREFTPSTIPDVSTDVGVATSFYQLLDSGDWEGAQEVLASGIGKLDLGTMYFGRSVEGTDSFEFLPFSRFPNPVYEILARAEYTVDGQTYSNIVLQRRWSESDPTRTAGIKTWLGMKRVDGTWKISNAFRGSSGEKILNRAVGSSWYGLDSVWEVNDQGVYRYQVGRSLVEMPFPDSTIYNTIWKPFVNPTLRRDP